MAVESIIETPWDSKAFGMDTYEIVAVTEESLEAGTKMHGHFTVRVDPLSSKELLHRHGYYYCDTLMEPYCNVDNFKGYLHESVSVSRSVPLAMVIEISHGAFEHGRFHRDFNISRDLADLRYDNWVVQLYESGDIFGLLYGDDLAAFFGVRGSKVVLHAVHERYRGKGLAKYFWTAGLTEVFNSGNSEVTSSVSASNTAVVNLYASLGFRFRNPVDIYHRLNP